MKIKITLTTLCLLFTSLPAHAIPPPDALMSVWQAALQFLGVAAVFIGGAIFSVRQFFGHYIVGWKRVAFYLTMALGFLILLWAMLGSRIAKAEQTPLFSITQGELVPIKQLIQREKDDWIREWKLATMDEMQKEFNLARQRKQLTLLSFSTVQSFSPERLNALIKLNNKNVHVLDIREEYERARFGIKSNGTARYGDLISNLIPDDLPKGAVIVVICHSGLRGYLGANLLKNAGFNAAFLQGGLAEWHVQKFPVHGTPEYNAKKRWLPNSNEARKLNALKVQVDAEGSKAVRNLPDLIQLPYETAATNDLTDIIHASKKRPVLLVCNTYGGCFHTINFAWLIEANGGKVAGVYDETDEHMANFF